MIQWSITNPWWGGDKRLENFDSNEGEKKRPITRTKCTARGKKMGDQTEQGYIKHFRRGIALA